MSLSTRILLSLLLGIAAGLFVGEPMGALDVVGDAFVRLLQMTVLPYVVVSLVAGLGHLGYAEARSLALKGGMLLLVLWALTFALVVAMPLAFPAIESASFFSTTLVASDAPVDFLGLYIPANPFYSLANNVVPAVVLFSIALGVALIGMEEKTFLLQSLTTLGNALLRVTDFVVRLTPIGVFAIAASASGTMTVTEFQRVQVYLVTYIGASLVLSLWLLPGLVASLTPIRHRDVLWISRDALITAFATGSVFVVIPLLAERSRELLRRHEIDRPDSGSLIDVVVPVSNSFPSAAKVLTLSFIVFAGWFIDTPVSLAEYPQLAVAGIASSFGSVNVAVPFLLDLMRLPHDLFQLFVATSVLNARFGTLLAAAHVLVLTLLVTCALTGELRLRWDRLGRFAAGALLLMALSLLGTRFLLARLVDATYQKDQIVWDMGLAGDGGSPVIHVTRPPVPELDPDRNRVDQIRERGVLRVGYRPEGSLPFSFRNGADELVGLDIELAHSLARGLGVALELVPVYSGLGQPFEEDLESGYCDIVMSRSALTMTNAGRFEYSLPYLELNIGLLVKDHRRGEFQSREELAARDDLRIAFPDEPYYRRRVARFLPRAELVTVPEIRTFLEDETGQFDAMVYAAEINSAWTLLYPSFSSVVPSPPFQTVLFAFPLPRDEPGWKSVVDGWIELKRADGTIQDLYDHYILGRDAEQHGPRWSVIRNVLGWVD